MSRIAFAVHDADGLKTDLVSSDFKVYKGEDEQTAITVIPNNDGTYYFEITESAIYTVTIKGTAQDEFEAVYLPTDDLVKQTDVDGSTIVYESGLKVKDNVFAPEDHNHDEDYNEIITFNALDFEIDTSSEVKLKDRTQLAGHSLLDNTLSLFANLRKVADQTKTNDAIISAVAQAFGGQTISAGVNKRTIFASSLSAGTSDGDEIGGAGAWIGTNTTYDRKFSCPFYMYEGDTTVLIRLDGWVASGGTLTIKAMTGDGYNFSTEVESVETDSAGIEIAIGITGATVGRRHDIVVEMKTSNASYQYTVSRYINVEVY